MSLLTYADGHRGGPGWQAAQGGQRPPSTPGGISRREFLLASTAAAGAVMFAGCVPPQREMQAESRARLAEDLLSAHDAWFATTCRGCAAGCGVVVRVVDGRARKVEGNPDHPINRGKLCARGQALVQEEYHPDRVSGPLQRDSAQRSDGAFQAISWPRALDTLVGRLRDLAQQGRAGDVSIITPPLSGHRAVVLERFSRAYGCKWLPFEPLSEAPLREAAKRVLGFDDIPVSTCRTRGPCCLSARISSARGSPRVRYGWEYGIFRQGQYDVRTFQPRQASRPRGRLIHVDTRFSATAANADEWVWVRPGAEGLLALSIAQALGSGSDVFAPEQTQARTGVNAARVRRIAGQLRDDGPGLVIGGGSAGAYTHGTNALAAILSLNVVLGNVGRPGGVLPPAGSVIPGLPTRANGRPLTDWQDLATRMADGQEQALLVLGGADPVHGLPAALDFSEALANVPFVAKDCLR
jgi:anaerobic selenocysteine-containing dehydrogenase